MKKLLKITAISMYFVLLSMPAAYAADQYAQVCLSVNNNEHDYSFVAGLKSSDFFGDGTVTSPVYNGEVCAGKTYKSGPKNIRLSFYVRGLRFGEDVKINMDSSCKFLDMNESSDVRGGYYSSYQRTGRAHEYWTFIFTKQANQHRSYNLTCQHWAA